MKTIIALFVAALLTACGTVKPDVTASYCSKFKTANEQWLCYQNNKPTGGNAE